MAKVKGKWEKRWETLKKQISDLKTQISKANPSVDTNPAADANRHKSFIAILNCLEQFGDKQFDYFYKGFGKDDGYYYLETSHSLPSEHTLYRTLQQLALDFSVLNYAWSQRTDGNSKEVKSTLNIADKLAYQALRPSIDAKTISPCTVITYLQKSPFIRLMPYARVAIIGVPFTAVADYDGSSVDEDAAFDLLAIPHEIGHFIYRHGQFKRDKSNEGWDGTPYEKRLVVEIADRLHGEPKFLQQWAEEIFADIYGVLIAGSIAALTIQELLQGKSKQGFTEDDNEHPIPAVRPYIHIETLRKMISYRLSKGIKKAVTDSETSIVEDINEKWDKVVSKRGKPNIKKQQEAIKFFVNGMVKKVAAFLPPPWIPLNTPLDNLKSTFAKRIISITSKSNVPEIMEQYPADPYKIYVASADPVESWLSGDPAYSNLDWVKRIRDTIPSYDYDPRIPEIQWRNVLEMAGWSIGPADAQVNPAGTQG